MFPLVWGAYSDSGWGRRGVVDVYSDYPYFYLFPLTATDKFQKTTIQYIGSRQDQAFFSHEKTCLRNSPHCYILYN